MKLSIFVITSVLFFAVPRGYCQWKELPSTGSPTERLPDRTTRVGQSGLGPLLIAKFVDERNNAKQHKAVIEVQTDGVQLVDPAAAHHESKIDEAHIQYRLDGGPIQNTSSQTWKFDQLSSGEHEVEVALAASDNHPIGTPKRLHVRIP